MPSAILPPNQNRLNTAATTDNKISSPNSWGVFGSIHAASSNTSAASMMRETFLPLAASKYGDGQANHNASAPASSSRVRRCSIWRLLSVRTSGGRVGGCFGTEASLFCRSAFGFFQTAFGNVRPSEKRILAVLTAEGRLANGLPLCCFSSRAEVMGKAGPVCVLRFVCCDVRPSEKRKRFFRRPFAAV